MKNIIKEILKEDFDSTDWIQNVKFGVPGLKIEKKEKTLKNVVVLEIDYVHNEQTTSKKFFFTENGGEESSYKFLRGLSVKYSLPFEIIPTVGDFLKWAVRTRLEDPWRYYLMDGFKDEWEDIADILTVDDLLNGDFDADIVGWGIIYYDHFGNEYNANFS